jgi:hypothetical protein
MKTFNNAMLNNILVLSIASTAGAAWAAFDDVGTEYTTDAQRYHVWN